VAASPDRSLQTAKVRPSRKPPLRNDVTLMQMTGAAGTVLDLDRRARCAIEADKNACQALNSTHEPAA
jgi:hypothetical protein